MYCAIHISFSLFFNFSSKRKALQALHRSFSRGLVIFWFCCIPCGLLLGLLGYTLNTSHDKSAKPCHPSEFGLHSSLCSSLCKGATWCCATKPQRDWHQLMVSQLEAYHDYHINPYDDHCRYSHFPISMSRTVWSPGLLPASTAPSNGTWLRGFAPHADSASLVTGTAT